MPYIDDEEFGQITIRRSAKARQVKISVAPNGSLRASLPLYAPTNLVKRLVSSSRRELRDMLSEQTPDTYSAGQSIGKSHSLIVIDTSSSTSIKRSGLKIIVNLSHADDLSDNNIQQQIRDVVRQALRRESKSYLPKRLAYLAEKYGYSYNEVRFSHASSRWGSCSSRGTISLNIALMKLPFELIDYVLLHELAHTREMNHSDKFWQLVSESDPNFKAHRSLLKRESPTI